MNKATLVKIVHSIARSLGYQRKGNLFWKTGKELTVLVHLQGSRWGKGVYVNFGVIPSKMIIKTTPPGPGYWPIETRAESFGSPFQQKFRELITDDEDVMSVDEIKNAFRWLFTWIEDNLTNETLVREAILKQDVTSGIAKLVPIPTEWVMADWATGNLKDPAYYYGDLPYYRR
jgi:hypothetical protein